MRTPLSERMATVCGSPGRSKGGAVYAGSGAVVAFTNSVFSENDVGSFGISP
jgi:hypothetical protein